LVGKSRAVELYPAGESLLFGLQLHGGTNSDAHHCELS
jgi:hypothetical protein